jgi:hypothetical protein
MSFASLNDPVSAAMEQESAQHRALIVDVFF